LAHDKLASTLFGLFSAALASQASPLAESANFALAHAGDDEANADSSRLLGLTVYRALGSEFRSAGLRVLRSPRPLSGHTSECVDVAVVLLHPANHGKGVSQALSHCQLFSFIANLCVAQSYILVKTADKFSRRCSMRWHVGQGDLRRRIRQRIALCLDTVSPLKRGAVW